MKIHLTLFASNALGKLFQKMSLLHLSLSHFFFMRQGIKHDGEKNKIQNEKNSNTQ